MEELNELPDLFLSLGDEPQEYTEPTLKDHNNEFKTAMTLCISCLHFNYFMAEAGFCEIAENNCICTNPAAMINMWDNKCDQWILNPREIEEIKRSISGFTCPYCEQVSNLKPIVRGEMEFTDFEGTYSWDEVHECTRCENLYVLQNGT
jgi:hypothetical protein